MWQRLPDEPTEALSGGAMVAPAHEAAPAAVELAHDGDRALAHDTTRLADLYAAFCATLQVQPHAGVLVFVRLRLPEFRPLPSPSNARSTTPRSERFGDADLYAFCDYLLRADAADAAAIFDHFGTVNLESCSISPTGAMMLCRLLAAPKCRVHTVALAHQRIGREGAAAIVAAARLNRAITRVQLKLAFISDEGAAEFSSLLADGAHSLTELDLSNNMISYEGCATLQLLTPPDFKLVLSGNRVLDEVLNASSHAIGIVLVVVGAITMAVAVAQENDVWRRRGGGQTYMEVPIERTTYTASTTIYLISLFTLYVASTLYHSMFALGEFVHSIFATIDFCAIYLLIAGTYTPFLAILFPDKPLYSVGLLGSLWAMAAGGVALTVVYRGPFKVGLHICSYVAMGWACLICAPELYARLSPRPGGLAYLLGGGVLYTAGVPFNVRDRRTFGLPDHTIWHLFVLGGSMLHYFCVYYYLLPFPYEDGDSNVVGADYHNDYVDAGGGSGGVAVGAPYA